MSIVARQELELQSCYVQTCDAAFEPGYHGPDTVNHHKRRETRRQSDPRIVPGAYLERKISHEF